MRKELFGVSKTGAVKHWIVETTGNLIKVYHGQHGGVMQEKLTVCKGKNVGRANETTPSQQAELEAQSKYNKQIDKGYRPTVADARNVGNILPMLAHNYLNHGHRIHYPVDVSPKLDGLRCLAIVDGDNVRLVSRGGKTYPCPSTIEYELKIASQWMGRTVFDGELYLHGKKLQDIVSLARAGDKSLQFHVFDIPSDNPWSVRCDDLCRLNDASDENCFISVFSVPQLLVNNEEEAYEKMIHYINVGFEGIVLRNHDGMYEYNHRSADMQKWKLMQDLEALIINAEGDKNGEAVYTLELPDKKVFKCKMKGSHESRRIENAYMNVGSYMVVKYQALTKDGIPQFPVGKCLRECDENGNPLE